MQIEEIHFQFTNKCSMKCEFCYIPFAKNTVKKEVCYKVIDKLKEINVEKITIGGGDPFTYEFIDDLIEIASKNFPIVHLDSSGKGFNNFTLHQVNKIFQNIKQIGLPLDGGNNQIHNLMRNSKDNFNEVIETLNFIKHNSIKVDIKINTVLSALNKSSLIEIAQVIEKYDITQWSIFQFWPNESNKDFNDIYCISDSEFNELIVQLKIDFPLLPIFDSRVDERKSNYFFIKHTGEVYTVFNEIYNISVSVGSIFENNTIKKWKQLFTDIL